MVTSRSTFPRGAPRHCDSLHHGRGPINYRPMTKPTTLGELKQTEWASPARIHRTVKDELRENLICLLENGSPLFPGIVGYEDSVIPQLVNAVLSRHNFILLGLRGQAKSRILRQLVTLLDEEIPILAGSEVNDNPFAPISKYGRERVTEQGADTPIAWLPREAATSCPTSSLCTSGFYPARTAASSRSTSSPISRARSRWACSTSCRRGTSRSKATRFA